MNKEDIIKLSRNLYTKICDIEIKLGTLHEEIFNNLHALNIYMCLQCKEIFDKPIDISGKSLKLLYCPPCLDDK